MIAEILRLVDDHVEDSLFVKASFTEEMQRTAETLLGYKLPIEFVQYIRLLGYGGIGGVDILGIGLTGNMAFLDKTLEYRKEGLPENLLVVENADEWVYCIDTNNGTVVEWHPGKAPIFRNSSFYEFVLEEFKDAIENL